MGSPQLSTAARWQIISIRAAGLSVRQIARIVDHHLLSTVSRFMIGNQATHDVKVLPRSGRPSITPARETKP